MRGAPHRVVIAGGGVAGLEALVALHGLRRRPRRHHARVPEHALRPAGRCDGRRVRRADAEQHDVAMIADDHGAHLLCDALHVVHREYATALTESGRELQYDSLLVAVGAHADPHPALRDALTFWGMDDVPAMSDLLADIEAGRARSVMFVVPPGATWTLPAYELALLCAQYAVDRSLDVTVTIATPSRRRSRRWALRRRRDCRIARCGRGATAGPAARSAPRRGPPARSARTRPRERRSCGRTAPARRPAPAWPPP